MEQSLDAVAKRLTELGERRLRLVCERVLQEATADLKAKAAANITSRMRERSRSLLTSLRHEMDLEHLGAAVVAGGTFGGLNVPYARMQEYGGRIVPIHGKYLAIPVGPALAANGTAKYTSARQAPKLVFVQSLRGQPLLVRMKKGAKGEPPPPPEVWYVLRTSVTLPGRRYLRDAWTDVVATLPARLAEQAAAEFAA